MKDCERLIERRDTQRGGKKEREGGREGGREREREREREKYIREWEKRYIIKSSKFKNMSGKLILSGWRERRKKYLRLIILS